MIGLAIIATVVFIEQGQRRLPVQYAKRMIGRKMYGGTSTYLPLKVNQAGVIPVIFATLAALHPGADRAADRRQRGDQRRSPRTGLSYYSLLVDQGTWLHILLYFALIIFFTYFYVGITVQPDGARGRAEEVRRLHPRYPAGPADGRVPAVRAQPDHPARIALPGHRGHPAEPVPVPHRARATTRTSRSVAPRC